MRRALVALLVFLPACGGGSDPGSAADTARACARALTDGDVGGACRLSDVRSQADCADLLRSARTPGDDPVVVERSSSAKLYDVSGPTEIRQVSVRRRDGRWRVHFEVQILR